MSKTRTFSALAAGMGMVAAACWFISGALPLQAAPQTQVAAGSPVSIRNISILGLSETQETELRARLAEAGIREGQQRPTPAESFQSTVQSIANPYYSRQPGLLFTIAGPDQIDLVIGTPRSTALRVGSNVQEAHILNKVPPVYPDLARAARVQGTVTLEVIIGKDGTVQDLHVISGHPLLIQSAMNAVRDWTYQPTLLNGQPVDVVTTVDVTYTLAP